jgi:hypothetical protein
MGKHIHIVGCSPRSGTTLMQEMMVACFSIDHHCAHERSLFLEEPGKAGITCTKQPREVIYAEIALRINPDLHVIYITRDPRDVVVSRHAKQPDKYFVSASFYLRAERCAGRLLNHPRFIVVRYEDLVCAPDTVQARIAERLPFLTIKHRFSEFHLHAAVSRNSARALNGVRPPDPGSIGKWRENRARVAAQVKKYPDILNALRTWGYETDAKWLDGLPAPDERMNESVLRDHDGKLYAARIKWKTIRRGLWYWFHLRGKP